MFSCSCNTQSHSPMHIPCNTHMHAHSNVATLGQSWEWIIWNLCANDRNYKPGDSLSSWGKINCVKSPCSTVGSIVCTGRFNINRIVCIWHCLTLNELCLASYNRHDGQHFYHFTTTHYYFYLYHHHHHYHHLHFNNDCCYFYKTRKLL